MPKLWSDDALNSDGRLLPAYVRFAPGQASGVAARSSSAQASQISGRGTRHEPSKFFLQN